MSNNYSHSNGYGVLTGTGPAYGGGKTRPATHAGTWYSDNPKELGRQLGNWLDQAGAPVGMARAIISPHAGYSYCGAVAGHAYKQINPEKVRRIFVLGPLHVAFLSGCALSSCAKFATPIGHLHVDRAINEELMSTAANFYSSPMLSPTSAPNTTTGDRPNFPGSGVQFNGSSSPFPSSTSSSSFVSSAANSPRNQSHYQTQSPAQFSAHGTVSEAFSDASCGGGSPLFEWIADHHEEAEHSVEMQMPFIAKVMERRPPSSFTIVPVLVGSLTSRQHIIYGRVFAKYLADPSNLFIISSDFCHWGHRFRYTPIEPNTGGGVSHPIYEQITSLDHRGMDAIATLDPNAFCDYLKRTQNTICGRKPIAVMLQAAEHFRQANNHRAELRWLNYAQSNKCRTSSDSSVSYAAGALFICPNNK